ncbi:MAG: hypothetical protein NC299_00920 [Lachnospiraceae bacterium]|nr:hypothetical protein [Ruminococcus sp.]MCM1273909.1 hypothetical protein [Lachnospiraceae bacterium]
MRFLSTICISAICTALFRMLVPENKYSKQISLLIAAVFLLTGITAVTGAEIDLDAHNYDMSASGGLTGMTADVNENLRRKVCQDMSDRLYELLGEHEIYPEEIHVIVNISGLYSINITQVKLVFGGGEHAAAEAAAELLSRELSEDIKVTAEVKE